MEKSVRISLYCETAHDHIWNRRKYLRNWKKVVLQPAFDVLVGVRVGRKYFNMGVYSDSCIIVALKLNNSLTSSN